MLCEIGEERKVSGKNEKLGNLGDECSRRVCGGGAGDGRFGCESELQPPDVCGIGIEPPAICGGTAAGLIRFR